MEPWQVTVSVKVDGEVPDFSIGQDWVVGRFKDSPGLPEGCPAEVALLETQGAAYLTREAARHLAGLLLAYAEES